MYVNPTSPVKRRLTCGPASARALPVGAEEVGAAAVRAQQHGQRPLVLVGLVGQQHAGGRRRAMPPRSRPGATALAACRTNRTELRW